jgi:hypothetical protein
MRNRKAALFAALIAAPLPGATLAETAVADETLIASMNGRQETEPGDRNGRGRARITTDVDRQTVCFRIRLRRVGTVTAGHIHRGDRGEAGPVVVPLFDEATRRPRGCVRNVERSTIRRIESDPGDYYVNVHNQRFPDGAVRGQLRERESMDD